MRAHTAGIGSVDVVVRTLLEEFPELDNERDKGRLRAAVERASARIANAALDTEGYQVVDMHLRRAEATEEATERAGILRELAETLEGRKDADRALVVRLSAFAEHALRDDIEPLLRLAALTDRWSELPLEQMTALVDIQDDSGETGVRRLVALAEAWQRVGRGYHAADCLERVLLVEPMHEHANDALELFYRSTREWPVLVDLLSRRAVHVEGDRERAELFRELAQIHARELADPSGALDAYREADRLDPDRPEVLEALAKLTVEVGVPDTEALALLERSAHAITDPTARARVLVRAGELAKLEDWDRAQHLFEAARAADPDLPEAIDGFVPLLRDRGQLADAVSMLLAGADRPALAAHRSRWLTDAGDFCVALGDTDWAKQLYLDARAADPANHKAAAAVVELVWDTGQLVELAPLLDELCRITDDPNKLREYLLQRSKIAKQLGDETVAQASLSRAIDLDPDDRGARRELAEMLFDAAQWAKAKRTIEGLLVDEDLLPEGAAAPLHYKLARAAKELGERETAAKHVDVALALAPDHREALLLRAELGGGDPLTAIADQLALAQGAPPDERATRFAAIGDRYRQLGDRAAAREMYREALAHKAGDHVLLTKFLEVVAEDGDWSYSLDVAKQLIETEKDAKVRARYRHLAAMIARDELDDHDQATRLLDAAIDEAPLDFAAADDLEALLATSREALARFLYRRLEHVRSEEGRSGERLRLWDRLGELSLDLGRHDDALVAFEVSHTLTADDRDRHERRLRLVDLYSGADAKHDAAAVRHHQAILAADHGRVASYKALRELYARAGRRHAERAVDDALALVAPGGVAPPDPSKLDALFETDRAIEQPVSRAAPHVPLRNDDWLALARLDVDPQLSLLLAIAAPPFAVERARMRPPVAAPAKEADVPPAVANVLDPLLALLVTPRPPIYIDRDQTAAAKLVVRTRAGVLGPVLVLGRPVADKQLGGAELAFQLARALADLRADRIARLFCPRAGELAQIIEMAAAPDPTRWFGKALHPVELEHARSIGNKLRERGVVPLTAAATWLAATERAADRIGLVATGDLAACTAVLDRDAARDLEWASVTEDVLGVRAHVEAWPDGPQI